VRWGLVHPGMERLGWNHFSRVLRLRECF
jgi:hypothetical protein